MISIWSFCKGGTTRLIRASPCVFFQPRISRFLHSQRSLSVLVTPSEGLGQKEERLATDRQCVKKTPRQKGEIRFTIRALRPDDFTKEDLLSDLKNLKFPESRTIPQKAPIKAPSNLDFPVLIILFTSQFASWFEDFEKPVLVPEILKAIKPFWSPKQKNVFDVICACVDGLSPQPSLIVKAKGASQPQEQGFSFLTGFVASNLWGENPVKNKGTPSSLTFNVCRSPQSTPLQQSRSTRNGENISLTLPLANTLFKTGFPSMLSVSQWISSDGGDLIERVKVDRERQNVDILPCKTTSLEAQRMPFIHIPATSLTPLRPIASGLGNIIRTIDFAEDGIRPASEELEAAVTQFLKFRRAESPLIDVWALVIPRATLTSISSRYFFVDSGLVRQIENNSLGYWVSRGARLCRVLSGGGGWGLKEGLLSLDPEVDYLSPSGARSDFSEESLEKQQELALGNVAAPGASIKFFVRHTWPEEKEPEEIIGEPSQKYKNQFRNTIAFGTVPSTIDDVSLYIPQMNTISEKSELILGHFGAVSESGMFLRISGTASDCSSKIDLPYSYLMKMYGEPIEMKGSKRVRIESGEE